MKSLIKYIQEAKKNIYISGKNKNKQAFYLYINKDKIDITPLSDGTWKYELNEPVNVTKGMFENQDNIVALDFRGFDTSNIKQMDDMFRYCKSLASLDLSNFDMNNVIHTNDMFKGCTALTSIYVTNCDAVTVAKIKAAVIAAGLSEEIVKTSK